MDSLWYFLNSQFFIALITLTAGLIAWFIYGKQRRDTKRDIANSILSETQYAEKSVERVRNYIRDTGQADINIKILQLNSWARHKHLFSSDFDEDEWGAINNFYANAVLLDDTLKQSNLVFESNAEHIRSNMQRAITDLLEVVAVNTKPETIEQDLKQLKDRAEFFATVYEDYKKDFTFTPVKYLEDTKRILEDIQSVSTSTAGETLKKLAGKKK